MQVTAKRGLGKKMTLGCKAGDVLLVAAIEKKRLQLSKNTEAKRKSQFGQFFTPERIAAFMAALFPDGTGHCRLLDAGAGIGSLSAAFLGRWRSGGFHFQHVEVDAFELDPALSPHLLNTLEKYNYRGDLIANIHGEDFIYAAVESLSGNLFSRDIESYTHAILNPP